VEGRAARERRWPLPSYARPGNVRVLTLHDPTGPLGYGNTFTFYI